MPTDTPHPMLATAINAIAPMLADLVAHGAATNDHVFVVFDVMGALGSAVAVAKLRAQGMALADAQKEIDALRASDKQPVLASKWLPQHFVTLLRYVAKDERSRRTVKRMTEWIQTPPPEKHAHLLLIDANNRLEPYVLDLTVKRFRAARAPLPN